MHQPQKRLLVPVTEEPLPSGVKFQTPKHGSSQAAMLTDLQAASGTDALTPAACFCPSRRRHRGRLCSTVTHLHPRFGVERLGQTSSQTTRSHTPRDQPGIPCLWILPLQRAGGDAGFRNASLINSRDLRRPAFSTPWPSRCLPLLVSLVPAGPSPAGADCARAVSADPPTPATAW